MALAPGQTLQSAYGYQGTPVGQWQPQVSQTVQSQYAALAPGGQGFSSSAFNPPRQSGRQTQPSQMYYGQQWSRRKNRKSTKKGGKRRKTCRKNTMRKGRSVNRR